MPDYTEEHARAGINTKLPALETWPNQFPGYIITTTYSLSRVLLRLPQDRSSPTSPPSPSNTCRKKTASS